MEASSVLPRDVLGRLGSLTSMLVEACAQPDESPELVQTRAQLLASHLTGRTPDDPARLADAQRAVLARHTEWTQSAGVSGELGAKVLELALSTDTTLSIDALARRGGVIVSHLERFLASLGVDLTTAVPAPMPQPVPPRARAKRAPTKSNRISTKPRPSAETTSEGDDVSPKQPAAVQKTDARRPATDEDPDTDTDLVGTYLREIAKTPLLSAVEEVELAKRIEAGLYAEHRLRAYQEEGAPLPPGASTRELQQIITEGQQAKARFVQANLRLVVSVARRYQRKGLGFLDLIQEGNAGVVRGVEKFDFTRGYKFSTYGTWWIRQAITGALAKQRREVRIPKHKVEELYKLYGVKRELARVLQRQPTPEDLARELDMDVGEVSKLLGYDMVPLSLDAPVLDGGQTLGDFFADAEAVDPAESAFRTQLREKVRAFLDDLPYPDAEMVRMRFGIGYAPHSYTQIAAALGVSRAGAQLRVESILMDLRGEGRPESRRPDGTPKRRIALSKRAIDAAATRARLKGLGDELRPYYDET